MNNIKRLVNIAIEGNFDAVIHYRKADGEESVRRLSELEHPLGYGPDYIEGFCHNRQERRNFKIDRIQMIELYNPDEDTPVPNMSASLMPSPSSPIITNQQYVFNPNKARFNL